MAMTARGDTADVEYYMGIRIFRDGDTWCAVYLDFENLQESPAGFGAEVHEAIAELWEQSVTISSVPPWPSK